MTTALPASSAARTLARPPIKSKIVPNFFMTKVKWVNVKRTRCANGGQGRAHYGREKRKLRRGNSNRAGRAEWLSLQRTKKIAQDIRSREASAAAEGKGLMLTAPAIHFGKW